MIHAVTVVSAVVLPRTLVLASGNESAVRYKLHRQANNGYAHAKNNPAMSMPKTYVSRTASRTCAETRETSV